MSTNEIIYLIAKKYGESPETVERLIKEVINLTMENKGSILHAKLSTDNEEPIIDEILTFFVNRVKSKLK